ncbi:Gfo/Idh/MocA family protein [Acetivibrio cellulolyticus]|uniref:Gfo/Idh/MocA family protein n=1 Tax=Acetivibrio cellulolyticus TaxID=35830 RepID=UPI0001E2F0A6|nr:Gfo/Idh/MocA family oxidoreductase [Acetivibrio cellulolyticus]
MKIGVVGCGYIANYYLSTMPNHPQLEVVGATDINKERAERFTEYYNIKRYNTLKDLLNDNTIDIVLNCTNPNSHYDVSKAALLANKYVYTEKPMGLNFEEASKLVNLARQQKLYIASSPSNILSEYAMGISKALADEEIGKVALVYANLDDGAVHNMRYWTWISKTGTMWPYKNEFEMGCIMEHSGYCLSLLTYLFGPVSQVQAYTKCLVPDKIKDDSAKIGPDYAEIILEFKSGVVGRITLGSVAPRNHSLTIVGEDGVISTKDLFWNFRQKVYIQHRIKSYSKQRKNSGVYLTEPEEYDFDKPEDFKYKSDTEASAGDVDWGRGVAELADSIKNNRRCLLDMDHALHVMEITDVIQNANPFSGPKKMKTTFEPFNESKSLKDVI